jgi:IclR family acetate operon transcriptional repressor
MTAEARAAYPIESVDRALTLLQLFERQDAVAVSDASALLGVSRSTAYRLLNFLAFREFVVQNERTKAYHAGPALLRLGLAAVQASDLLTELRPLLEELCRQVEETAQLVILQGREAVYLDCVEGPRMVRATSRVGHGLPAHCSAAGKVLLANLTPEKLDTALPDVLPRLTERSKTSDSAVRRELENVRKHGYAINDQESEPGLRAVAVLIPKSGRRSVDAAVSVAGPAQRLEDAELERIARVAQGLIAANDATPGQAAPGT